MMSQQPGGPKKLPRGSEGKLRPVKVGENQIKGNGGGSTVKKEVTASGDTESILSSPDMAGVGRSKSSDQSLDKWNPMDDDYNSPVFNSYSRPSPNELVKDFHGHSRPREPELQLYVTGIPTDMDESGVRNLFSTAGKVGRVKIGTPKQPNSFTTFGFVTMSSARELEEAIKQLHGYAITDKCNLRVSVANRDRQQRSSLPYQKARPGDQQTEEGIGPYYRNISRKDIHQNDGDDREISESSPGHIKVHLRRSNSREEDEVRGTGQRQDVEGSPGGDRDGRDAGTTGPATERGVEGIIPTARDQMAMLLGMQQMALHNLMNSRMTMNPATFPGLINPAMLSLLGPTGPPGATASLEDVTTPPKAKKMQNGGLEAGHGNTEGSAKDGADMLVSIGVKVSDQDDKIDASSTESETAKKSHKSSELKICVKCGKPGKKKCSICHSQYCSANCQQEDWPKHSGVCQQLKKEADAKKAAEEKDVPAIQYDGTEYASKDMKGSRPTRKEMKITGTYQESPAAFWVQVVSDDNIAGYNTLFELMETTFNDQFLAFQPVKPQVGNAYACYRDDDNCWYRSVVKNVATPDKIDVHFVDFGDEATVSTKNLRLLNRGMIQLPFLSFKCCLKGVEPSSRGAWTKEAIECFGSLVLDKLLIANFSQPRPQDRIFYLTKIVDEKGVDVIEELLKFGFAKSIPQERPANSRPSRPPQERPAGSSQKFSPQDKKPSGATPDKPRTQESERGELTKKSPLQQQGKMPSSQQGRSPHQQQGKTPPPQQGRAPYQQGQTPSPQRGKFPYQQQGKTPSPLQGESPFQQQGKSPFQQQGKAPSTPGKPASALPPPVWKKLKAGDRLCVCMSAVDTDGQLLYAYLTQSAAPLADMQDRLQICYGNSERDPEQRYQKDDVIAAVFDTDDQWYRARVHDVSTMSIYFVDYGGKTKVSTDKCRALQPEFSRLALQCLEMRLEGIADEVDSELIEEWAGGNRECTVEVMKIVDGVLLVRLFKSGPSGECLNDRLLAKSRQGPNRDSSKDASPKTGQKTGEATGPVAGPDPGGDAKPQPITGKLKRRVGECLEVALMEVTSMTEIWACLVSDETAMNNLGQQLHGDYGDSKPGFSPKVGQMCVAMFEGAWFRALVKAKVQGDRFKAFFIDYGNTSEVGADICRELLPKYLDTPPFPIRLHLENTREEENDAAFVTALQNWSNGEKLVAKITGVVEDRYLTRISKVQDEADCFNDILGDVPAHPPVPGLPVVQSLAVGDVLDMLVTEKQVDPYLFYAVPQNQGEALQKMSIELPEACQGLPTPHKYRPDVGQLCCSMYMGDGPYRAWVQDISGDKAHVLFIDFGNIAEVFIKDCSPLPSKFVSVPMQAVRCRLDAVAEMAIEKVDMFRNVINQCHLRVTRKDGDILVGVLWQGDGETGRLNRLADVELESQNSGPAGVGEQVARNPALKSSQSGKAAAAPTGRDQSVKATNSHEGGDRQKDTRQPGPSLGEKPKQGGGINNSRGNPKQPRSPKTGEKLPSLPFPKASSLPQAPAPLIGKFLPACQTHLETLEQIYFQLFVKETLEILSTTLNNEEFTKLKDSMKEYRPQVGELCMAFVTDQWCRAEVLRVEGSKYTLFIVDYGSTENLKCSQLRPALPAFLQSKPACLRCSLFGVQPLGQKNWSKEVVNFARNQLESSPQSLVQIKVMDVIRSVLMVEVLIPSDGGRPTSLAEQLITKGYAKEKLITSGPVVSVPHPLDQTELKVSVYGVVNPRDFYCQIIDKDNLEQLVLIQKAVAEHAQEQSPNPGFKPTVSQYCLAKFTEDESWNRARVAEVGADGRYKVQFIDFGNYDTVPQDHLLAMPAAFAEVPAMTIPCSLSGLDASNVSAVQLEKLTKAFASKVEGSQSEPYTAKVAGTKNFVTEVTLATNECKDIGEELLTMLSSMPGEETHPGAAGTRVTSVPGHSDPVMSELEMLKAELAAKDRENQELKKLLNK